MSARVPISFLALLLFACLHSCEKIEEPYQDGGPDDGNGTSTEGCGDLSIPADHPLTRTILVEDFTGHKCGNCPNAALEAEQLKQQYGEQVVIAGVHSGFFAETQGDTGMYSTDFTTEAGETYNSYWSIDDQGLPQGMISREVWNNSRILGPSEWSNAVDSLVGDSVDVSLQMAVGYDAANRTVCVDVATRFLEPMLDTLATTVYLLEDSIIDWQKNYSPGGDPAYPSPDAENYKHDHVLRAVINGTWGEIVLEGSANAGEEAVRSYSQELEDEWNAEKLSVIAYVYDREKEHVLQAIKKKVP